VNTSGFYERRLDRSIAEPAIAPEAEDTDDALAVHRDPSVPGITADQESDRARPTVAWVRPSEVPTLLGASVARRGIDLQAELARRARRGPGAAVSKVARRTTRTSIIRPESASTSAPIQEGLGL
jgi:hypothetical protein